MAVVTKPALVWGKVISFLQGGEPGPAERVCIVLGPSVPTQVSELMRKWCHPRLGLGPEGWWEPLAG